MFQSPWRRRFISLTVAAVLLFPAPAGAIELGPLLLAEAGSGAAGGSGAEDPEADLAEKSTRMVDDTHGRISRTLLTSSEWLDSFFEDEEYEEEINRTRMKVKLKTFVDEDGPEFDASVSFKLVLPEFEDRLSLEISGDGEDDIDLDAGGQDVEERIEQTEDRNVTTALRYLVTATDRLNISLSGGLRLRDIEPVVFIGPRYRESFDLDPWLVRFTQRFRWFTDTGVESKTRFDFERPFLEKYYFRFTTEGNWYENEDGFFYRLNHTVSRPLGLDRAIELQWNNYFQTRPYNRLEVSAIRLRYRTRMWRDWIIFEAAPQVAFPKSEDYEPTPGLLIRFDLIFGFVPDERI